MKKTKKQLFSGRKAGILVHPTSFPGPYGIGDLGPAAYRFLDFLKKQDRLCGRFCLSVQQAQKVLLISPILLLQDNLF